MIRDLLREHPITIPLYVVVLAMLLAQIAHDLFGWL